jgi:hypothetical protein
MKQPNALLKLAAVVSSLVLFGGFVSYRAGAFNSLLGPGENAADSGSSATGDEPYKLELTTSDPLTFEGRLGRTSDALMSSSKSIILFNEQPRPNTPSAPPATTPQQPPPDAAQRPPTIMSSSKSAAVFVPAQSITATPPPAPSQQAPPATKQAAPTIISGTKSATIFPPTLVPPPPDKPPTPPATNNAPRESPR